MIEIAVVADGTFACTWFGWNMRLEAGRFTVGSPSALMLLVGVVERCGWVTGCCWIRSWMGVAERTCGVCWFKSYWVCPWP